MSAVMKGGPYSDGAGSTGVGRQRPETKWERTPWWMFWRPYWRRWPGRIWPGLTECDWEYRTKQQLAHEFLEKQFSNEKLFNQKHQGIDSRLWTGRPR